MFNVNASLFRLVALFQSTEQTRYYLIGVHIEAHPDGGALLVATDGHRMLVAHDATGQCDAGAHGFGYIVQLDKTALAACKPSRLEGDLPEMQRRIVSDNAVDPAWVTAADGDQLAIVKGWNVDGSFPDWRRVLPKVENLKAETQCFDPSLFAEFAAVQRHLTGKGPGGILIETTDKEGPALIRFAGAAEHIFGVLMPMRSHGAHGLPAFMSPKPAVEKAA